MTHVVFLWDADDPDFVSIDQRPAPIEEDDAWRDENDV